MLKLNLNIFIPRMAITLFHDGQSYLKYDQCNVYVHVNTSNLLLEDGMRCYQRILIREAFLSKII